MKKILTGFMCIGMLVLMGCTGSAPAVEPKAEVGSILRNQGAQTEYFCTKGYAKSPTHFYAVQQKSISSWGDDDNRQLYRAPFDALGDMEKIQLPITQDGVRLYDVSLCGLTETHVYVNRQYGEYSSEMQRYAVFRVALDTFEAEFIGISDFDPGWYHPGSDSVLLLRCIGENENMQVEAIDMMDKRMTVIYKGEAVLRKKFTEYSPFFSWRNMADNSVLLRSSNFSLTVLIDAENYPTQLEEEEYWRWVQPEAPSPQNEAERKILAAHSEEEGGIDWSAHLATCGDYTYYIHFGEHPYVQLRRMNADGSGDRLLWTTEEEGAKPRGVISVGGKLFCYTRRWYEYTDNSNVEYQLQLLDEDGKVVKTLMQADTERMNIHGELECLKEFNGMLLMYGGRLNVSDTGFMALYDPAEDALFTLWDPNAPENRFPGEDTLTLSWAKNDTHFFAALDKWSYSDTTDNGELCYAALDGSGLPQRIPLPIAYEGKTLYDVRISKVDDESILVGRCTDREDRTEPWAMYRVPLDTFVAESLGLSVAPPLPETAPDKTLLKKLFPVNEWDALKLAERESVPMPDYEIYSDYAVTPTHLFAVRGGEVYCMPERDIAGQEKISLPKKYKELVICGLTEQWLFVSGCPAEREYYEEGQITTWRINLNTLQAEELDKRSMTGFPRYNRKSNSLLYLLSEREDSDFPTIIKAVNLETGKHRTVLDFTDYFSGLGEYHLDGWFNAPDGSAVFKIWVGWDSGHATCLVFGKNDAVRLADISAIPGVMEEQEEESETPAQSPIEIEMEKKLRDSIVDYIAYGEYVYYVEAAGEEYDPWGEKDFYRVKKDGSDKKLLRAKTNIFQLMLYDEKLHCLAYLPDSDGEAFGLYFLDENGKVAQTVARGYYGEWGGHTIQHIGHLVLFVYQGHWSSEDSLTCLYDPATGAMFSMQE